MVPIVFDKDAAKRILESIRAGKPIEVPTIKGFEQLKGWDTYSLLAVAAACHFALLTRGPKWMRDTSAYKALPTEHKEAEDETLYSDVSTAIEFCGQLSMQVVDNEYDEMYEPVVHAIVGTDDGKKMVEPIKGFKNA